ncbi:MAG: hypothetical protein EU541_06980 [Promethearchaeota archaeon]|nr:MAG: hypothetical protein EU541_06980 [Candidatus Lokiarchaeota archaeon]
MRISKNRVFSVYIFDEILKKVKNITEKYEFEVFGYLIGELFQWNSKLYIIINDMIYIESCTDSTRYSVSQIKGSAGEYEKEFRRLKKKNNNKNLRVLGWWHSHPNLGCFLSSTDLSTQKFFFPESYQVALVIDPMKKNYKFFTLDENNNKGYKEVSHAIIR